MVKKIAVTGGIGSGKSTVINILTDAGYKVLSCDKITAELYEKRRVKLLLKKMFPTAVKGYFFPQIDRKIISAAVFNDKEKLNALTSAITPLVMDEVERRCKKLSGIVFVEVPLLFECNYQSRFDGVMVVMRDKESRIESVKTRSNLTKEEIVARMNSQVDYDSINLSPFVIVKNDRDFLSLKNTVLSLAKSF